MDTIEGTILTGRSFEPIHGRVVVEEGRITAVEETSEDNGDQSRIVLPAFVNAHTHVGDSVAKESAVGLGLEAAVVPPDSLKHQQIAAADPETLIDAMHRTLRFMQRTGTAAFLDFRESGVLDDRASDNVGMVVVGHGTERNENSAKAVQYHADQIRQQGRFEQVEALFMDEEPEVEDLTEHVHTEDIVVVPLFIADGYHTQEDIPEDIGLTDDYRKGYDVPATVDGRRVWYTGAVGTDPLVADVILERVRDAK